MRWPATLFSREVRVTAAICGNSGIFSHVAIVTDLPDEEEEFTLRLEREVALQLAHDIKTACAVIERGERTRDDA